MPDKQLEYWYDWSIYGPDSKELFTFKKMPPPIEKEKLKDVRYLCDRVGEYPNATLMNKNFWYAITMLRQRALKDDSAAKELEAVCKAIRGRARKKQDSLKDLIKKIKEDIKSFKEILERIENEGQSISGAIDFVSKAVHGKKAHKRRFQGKKNYERVFTAYIRAYKKLSNIKLPDSMKPNRLTSDEIFYFFEKAADHVFSTNADFVSDGRHLTFVKKDTWYVWGSDMKNTMDSQQSAGSANMPADQSV